MDATEPAAPVVTRPSAPGPEDGAHIPLDEPGGSGADDGRAPEDRSSQRAPEDRSSQRAPDDRNAQPVRDSGPDARPDGWYIYMVKLLDSALRPPFERVLRGHGLTAAQYAALSVLNVRPGITSSELARRSFVRAQSMADTVAVLLEQSWVRREPDPVNARRLLLHPTAQGGQVLLRVRQDVTELQDRLLAGFDAERLAGLDRDLRQLRNNLQELNEATP